MAGTHDDKGAFAATTPIAGAAAPSKARLADGTLLANRWRIVRFLAEGGMGQVYEADDQSLRERVALKTLRPEVAEDEKRLERFRREIQLARKVTHPNVCRIFDMGTHEGLTFLTMELVGGETLAHRLRDRGRMTPDDARPIALQMCAALGAAHAAGVVHRDFKSPNVLLDGARAVVTDFGLARTQGGDASLTQGGDVLGTPAYMAPEQVVGGAVGPPADVYALGVVLYEMVTGALPFAGDTPMAVAARRLEVKPPSPRQLVPSLDGGWDSTILRCMAKDPAARPTVDDVAAALRAPGGRRSRAPLFVAAAVAVSVLAVGGVWLAKRGGSAKRSAAGASPAAAAADAGPAEKSGRRSLAILGFKNLGGRADADWMSPALVELLTVELADEDVRLVAGETVARAKQDLALADAPTFAPDTLTRLRANLGADWVLVGSYLPQNGQIDLVLHVQDAASGELAAEVRVRGADNDLAALAKKGADDVRVKLGATGMRTLAALPSDPDVVRNYSEGVEKLRREDVQGARDLLRAAVQKAPDFAMGHYYLARAWEQLGYDPEAQAAAARAFELSTSLPRDEKLLIEAQYRRSRFEWDREIEILRSLFEFHPDDLDLGLQLANAQYGNQHEEDGKATVRRLLVLAPDDPRVQMLDLGSAKDEQELDRRYAALEAKARALSARKLLADVLLDEAEGAFSRGDDAATQTKWEEAKRLYGELHAESDVLECLLRKVRRSYRSGDLASAGPELDQAMEIARRVGNEHAQSNVRQIQGELHFFRDELDEARTAHQEALALRKRLCRRWCEALSHLDLALVELQAGRLDEAVAHLDAAEPVLEKFEVTLALRNLKQLRARVLVQRGRAQDALDLLAGDTPTDGGDEGADAMVHAVRGQALAKLGDTAKAREELETAIALARRRRAYPIETYSRIQLAHVTKDRAALAAIAKEARDKQFLLLARLAAAR